MVNRTGARGPMPSGFGPANRVSRPKKKREPRRFGFWDFLLPAILGGVIFVGLSLALLTVGPRAMSLSTYLGGWTVLVLLVVVALLFLVPIVELFIMPRTALKLMIVMWPTDALVVGLAVWVMTHVSIPI